jgi:hypothetical protein
MKMKLSILVVVLALFTSAQAQEEKALAPAKTIPLPDVQGGFNHMSSDIKRGYVFATATTIKTVEIVDMKSGELLHSLSGDGAAAALFAPEFNQLYVTRNRKVCIYDGTSFVLLTNINVPSSVDELGYNPNKVSVNCG